MRGPVVAGVRGPVDRLRVSAAPLAAVWIRDNPGLELDDRVRDILHDAVYHAVYYDAVMP